MAKGLSSCGWNGWTIFVEHFFCTSLFFFCPVPSSALNSDVCPVQNDTIYAVVTQTTKRIVWFSNLGKSLFFLPSYFTQEKQLLFLWPYCSTNTNWLDDLRRGVVFFYPPILCSKNIFFEALKTRWNNSFYFEPISISCVGYMCFNFFPHLYKPFWQPARHFWDSLDICWYNAHMTCDTITLNVLDALSFFIFEKRTLD